MPVPRAGALRVYIPATLAMLQALVADQRLNPVSGTAFAVTPALWESYASGDEEELAEVAMAEAARASLRLIAADHDAAAAAADRADAGDVDNEPPVYRRAVIAADVEGATPRPDLDPAVVRLAGPIQYRDVASVHVDLGDAEPAIAKAVDVIDAADLGDEDAEFVLGDAEDHPLAWYAAAELPFLLELR